jgi:hypothetical protein
MTTHTGRHAFEANCGAYRPAPGVTCESCPPKCPECGSFYRPSREQATNKYPVPTWLPELKKRIKAKEKE